MAENNKDVNIRIGSNFNDEGIKRAKKSIASLNKNYNSAMKNGNLFSNGSKTAAYFSELNHSYNKVMKSSNLFNKNGTLRVQEGFTSLNSVMKTTMTQTEQIGQHMKRFQRPFAGYAMSIMFAGMALQRTFSTITKFGVKTFDEISHSVEGTVTKNDMLQGSMKYLGFTIGQALEPLIGFLIPIIDKISEWVEANPKLTSTIIALGIALGALMTIGGGLKLAIDGFKTLKDLTSAKGWEGVGKGISNGIGIIAIGYALNQAVDAYKDFEDGKIFTGITNALSGAALAIGGIRLIKGAKGGGALIAIGVGLEYVSENESTWIKDAIGAISYVSSVYKASIDFVRAQFNNLWDNLTYNIKLVGLEIKKIWAGVFGGDTSGISAQIKEMKELIKLTEYNAKNLDWTYFYKQAMVDTANLANDWQKDFNNFNNNIQESQRQQDRMKILEGRTASPEELRQILINEVNISGLQGQGFEAIIDEIVRRAQLQQGG